MLKTSVTTFLDDDHLAVILLWLGYGATATSMVSYRLHNQEAAQLFAALGLLLVILPFIRFAITRTHLLDSAINAFTFPLGILSLPWLIAVSSAYSLGSSFTFARLITLLVIPCMLGSGLLWLVIHFRQRLDKSNAE